MLAQSRRNEDHTSGVARFIELAGTIDDPAGLTVLGASTGYVVTASSTGGIQNAAFYGEGHLEGMAVHDAGSLSYEGRRRTFTGALDREFSDDDGSTVARLGGGHVGWHRLGRAVTLRVVSRVDAPASVLDGALVLTVVDVLDMNTYAAHLYLLERPKPRRGPECGPGLQAGRAPEVSGEVEPEPEPEAEAADQAAWLMTDLARNWTAYFGALCWRLRSFPPDDAQDAVQDAIERLIRRRHQFDAQKYGTSGVAILAYLNRIARSIAISTYWSELSRHEREKLTAAVLSDPRGDPQHALEQCPLDDELTVAIKIAVSTFVFEKELLGRSQDHIDIWRRGCQLWVNQGVDLVGYLHGHGAYRKRNTASVAKTRFLQELLRYLEPLGFSAGTDGETRAATPVITVLDQFDDTKLTGFFTGTADLWALGDLLEAGIRLVLVPASTLLRRLKRPLHVDMTQHPPVLTDGRGTPIGRLHAQLLDVEGATRAWIVSPAAPPAGRRSGR